jgi:hypothetical protein
LFNIIHFSFFIFTLVCLFFFMSCEQSAGERILEAVEVPIELETGILLSVIVPEELKLTGDSRALIESLGEDGFEPLTIPVTETIRERRIPLPAGRYSVDVLLVETGGKFYSALEEIEVKAAEYGEGEEWADAPAPQLLSFEPDTGAFLSESEYGSLTAAPLISTTAENSAGLKITKLGGSGAALTREMAVLPAAAAAYFTVKRKTTQTLAVSGADGAAVNIAQSAADGESPGITDSRRGIWKDVFIVDTSRIAAGGSIKFIITVTEPEKNSISYTVTLTIPSVVSGSVILLGGNRAEQWGMEIFSNKVTYLVGEPFDPSSVQVTCVYSDNSKRRETVYEVRGFDTSQAGNCPVQFFKNGPLLTFGDSSDWIDKATNTLNFNVIELMPPHLFFDYGKRISAIDPVPGRYTVTEGRKLVIAPVLWRIPAGATFTWTLSGSASYEANGEFLTFKTDTQAGNYNVTVTASFTDEQGAAQTVSASTVVECVNAESLPSDATVTEKEKNCGAFAPGDHLWYAGSLGGFGGYYIREIHVDNYPGYDIVTGGNAFAGWEEPGVVWVMKDENRNGMPDDTWYELKGSVDESAVTRRYAVTFYKNHAWQDNMGRWGSIRSDYPTTENTPDVMTFVGTAIDVFYVRSHANYGYADTSDIRCDIRNAVQVDGTPLDPPLDHVDFVKQHTGVHAYTASFGEISTETSGGGVLWLESRIINGTANGSGGYDYRFVNPSGYDVTVYLKHQSGDSGTKVLKNGGDVTITLSAAQTVYMYNGGNVTCTVSGNTLTFKNN